MHSPPPSLFVGTLIVWSGSGVVNGNAVTAEGEEGLEQMEKREMFVPPQTELTFFCPANANNQKMLLLSVYPFAPAVHVRTGIAVAGLSCVDYVIQQCGELTTSTDHVRAKHYEKRCGGSVYNTAKALRHFSVDCRVEALTLVGTGEWRVVRVGVVLFALLYLWWWWWWVVSVFSGLYCSVLHFFSKR